jgi:hypothetical protein
MNDETEKEANARREAILRRDIRRDRIARVLDLGVLVLILVALLGIAIVATAIVREKSAACERAGGTMVQGRCLPIREITPKETP